MKVEPIWGERALFIDELKALVIADLHIGIEYELYLQGINIASQTDKLLKRCKQLIEKKKAKKLFIVGDLKHVIGKESEEYYEMMKKERKEVRYFLKELGKEIEIHIIKGNHDGLLKSKYAKIYGSRGLKIKNIAFLHGHAWPSHDIMNADLLIMGHVHPFVRIKTKVGFSYLEPCWVRGRFKKEKLKKYGVNKMNFIIMPAFNPLCGGIAVNSEELIGPMAKMLSIDNAEIYLLNGLNLGRVRNLK